MKQKNEHPLNQISPNMQISWASAQLILSSSTQAHLAEDFCLFPK